MKRHTQLPYGWLFFVFFLLGACREVNQPTATAVSATPIPVSATPPPTPFLLDLGQPLPPQVIGQNPPPGAELPLDGALEIYFDQPMQPDTAVTLTDAAQQPIPGRITWPQPRILRFKPTTTLRPASHYQATLDTTALSADGVALLEGLTLDFYTIGDIAISQISPVNGAENVATDSTITVIFNRPVVPLLLSPDAATLPNPLAITPPLAGQGEWVNTSVYVYRPTERLLGREQYTVRILAEVINEISATGAKLADDAISSFTVAPPTFNSLELVNSLWNPRGEGEVLRLDQAFRFYFNQPMEPDNTETAVSLHIHPTSSHDTAVPLAYAWSDDHTTLTITPTELLQLNTAYTLRLADSATAVGGSQLAAPFSQTFRTVKPPAIVYTEPANGQTERYYSSYLRLEFASPMDEESMAGKVIITPDIFGDPNGLYSFWDWSQNYYGFHPSTTYTVQILPGMKDIYGNEISNGYNFSFTTGELPPTASFNLPYSIALYRRGGSDSLWVTHQNITQMTVDLYALSLPKFGDLLHYDLNSLRYTPTEAQHIWQRTLAVDTPLDELAHKRFILNQADTGPLPTGYYFAALDSPQVRHTENYLQAQVLVMATANVVLKTTTNEAMIWVTDLNTGQPLPGVPVTLYDQEFQLLFQGETDASGLLYRDDLELLPGWDGRYYAVAGQPGDEIFGLAISNWNAGISTYDFGIYTDFYLQPNQPTAYVYTERPIYRPGQPVYYKGIIRLNDDLSYNLPDFDTVNILIASYDEVIYTTTLPLSDYGSFAGELTLADEVALGNYGISVSLADGRSIGNGFFEVAEFRKPTFQVDVTTTATDVAAGDTIQVTIDARFFSGGAVVNGDVAWHVRSTDYLFTGGPDLGRYDFHNRERDLGYYDYYNAYQPEEVIAEGVGQTDREGQLRLEIPAQLKEGDGSRRFVIEATVTDLAGNQVSGRQAVIVHRSHVYPGIASQQAVGEAGEAMGVDVVVVDWHGRAVSNHPVAVTVVERRWYSVQEEDDEGRTIWRSEVEEIPVAVLGESELVTDENGRTTFQFIPPNGGVFRAYVATQDTQGNPTRASTYLWVSGDDYVPWRQVNDHSFELISDKSSYQPGETAEILIASPFQGEVAALVTVERGHIKQQEVIQLVTNSTIYRLPITADMAPNVFVSVMVIKGVDETSPAPDFKLGMTQFTVDRQQQALTVTIMPDKTAVSPGDTVNFTIHVSDYTGQPVDAELSLSLTDLAVLTIADRKELPLLDHFYSERYLSVNTATLLAYNMDAYNQELEDEIKGGGGGGGSYGVLVIREEFPDTTYWQGQLATGPDGEATVAVTLPDNLTTWRMDVRAVTLDTKVGQTTSDIVSTLPVLISPQTPRFFVAGDMAQLGAVIHNNTAEEITAVVTLDATGATLTPSGTQTVTVPAQQQAFVIWTAVIPDVPRVNLVFSVQAGPYSDTTRPPQATLPGGGLPVYKYEVPETVGTSGQLLDGGVIVESLSLPLYPNYELTQGTMTVQVAPSLAAAMTDGLNYLAHFPYECTEQLVSKFLPNLLTVRAMQTAGIDDPALQANLDDQVNVALQRLYSRQLSDGGWPWWTSDRSDTLVTGYVVLALLEAAESGYVVSEDVRNAGVSYLQSHLWTGMGAENRYQENRLAFLLYVLARADVPNNERMNTLYDRRASLALYAQGFLAQALFRTDATDPRLPVLLSDFISHAELSASGAHWEEAQNDYWNWNSDTRTTAIVLHTMIQLDPDNPLVANAVRWLMAHRVDGRWAGTQETAWTLMALTNFMVASGELEADYEYQVAVNGELRLQGTAVADTLRQTQQLQLDITELLTDEMNRLAIGRTDGPGNLYYTTHLEAYLPVEQVQPLDQGIIISRSYFDPADRTTPITEIAQGETFLARLTIVVPNSRHYVVIEDFLPAGLEVIDQSLQTSQQVGEPELYTWEEAQNRGWGWWVFNHVELHDEKVVLSADYLPAGTYEYVYLVRASFPGNYRVIPPTAQEFYFPEVYGRGAGSIFTVLP